MKKVLIIDENPLFREYLKQKLSEEQIEVVLTQERRDSFTKMITNLPNLIIYDIEHINSGENEFFEQKSSEPNTATIPTIITGPHQDKNHIASLAKYGVIKYFEKPVQFDLLLESIGKVLKTPLYMDDSPCVLDIHRNGEVIFIELAMGLNHEKIMLMRHRLIEMINRDRIDVPKVVIMLTNLKLTFADGFNLEFLIDNILSCPKVQQKNVKVLSLSQYMSEFLIGHADYNEIEMATTLPRILTSLLGAQGTSNVSDLITDKILSQSETLGNDSTSVDTRFSSDTSVYNSASKNTGTVLKIAVIDDNLESQQEIISIFNAIGGECVGYTSGQEFLQKYHEENFNAIILDVLLKDQTGLNLIRALNTEPLSPPVVVYSQGVQRDFIVKILTSGAKGFLLKPQKPQVLVSKVLSLLNN